MSQFVEVTVNWSVCWGGDQAKFECSHNIQQLKHNSSFQVTAEFCGVTLKAKILHKLNACSTVRVFCSTVGSKYFNNEKKVLLIWKMLTCKHQILPGQMKFLYCGLTKYLESNVIFLKLWEWSPFYLQDVDISMKFLKLYRRQNVEFNGFLKWIFLYLQVTSASLSNCPWGTFLFTSCQRHVATLPCLLVCFFGVRHGLRTWVHWPIFVSQSFI